MSAPAWARGIHHRCGRRQPTIRASCWAFGHRSARPSCRDRGWEPTRRMAPGAHPGAIGDHWAGGATCPSCPSCLSSCWPIWSPHGGSNPHSVGPSDSVSSLTTLPPIGLPTAREVVLASVCEMPRYALSGSRVPGQRKGFGLTGRSPRPETVCRDTPILQAFTHSR